ncbi:MAG: NADH-quinone oxidoreductase subunit M, partial [Gammaproteobacteria bacterium]|nr:NADH-quinone oxidoreductase subunit M [Gammaproteobacteria bacterium]
MILTWLIALLFVGGLLAWFSERIDPAWPRWVALAVLTLELLMMLSLLGAAPEDGWLAAYNHAWLPRFGIA